MIEYLCHILTTICIFAILALSLDLLVGYLGLLSLAQAGYYGVGAYVSALMALDAHTPFLLNLLAAAVVTGALALLVAWCSLRIHDDHFVLLTFGVQVILFSVFRNWVSLTAGTAGLGGIPYLHVFGLTLNTPSKFLLLPASAALICFLLIGKLTRSPYGRVLKAIRDDEVFTRSLGKNVRHYKLACSVLAAMMAAVAGTLYAHYITYIDPTSFTTTESILVISMVILGGAANLRGPLFGAAFLIAVPEILRFIGIPETVGAEVRQVTLGVLIVLVIMFRPQGLFGSRGFGRAR